MSPRLISIVIGIVWVLGCNDSDGNGEHPGFDPGPTPAGSCEFAERGTCDEYAEPDATASTGASCEAAGGVWLSGKKCPFDDRTAVCTVVDGATRTYSYTVPAAESLEASCPEGKFVMYEVEQEPQPQPDASTMDAGDEDAGA